MNKHYISAQQLLDDSFNLALKILDSDYRPDLIVAIWRGGAPVAIAVHELFEYFEYHCDHIAIRTALYEGIEKQAAEVKVQGLSYVTDTIAASERLLIVDDVHDTGLSVRQVIAGIKNYCGDNTPHIRVATAYYKPNNNQVGTEPDYFVHQTDEWLVFPHELVGLSMEEILKDKPGMDVLRSRLAQHNQ